MDNAIIHEQYSIFQIPITKLFLYNISINSKNYNSSIIFKNSVLY